MTRWNQAWPSRAQLAHFGRAKSHLSLRLRQTRHAVSRFLSLSAEAAVGVLEMLLLEGGDGRVGDMLLLSLVGGVLCCSKDGAMLTTWNLDV